VARILIVDDSTATRMKMKLILSQAGHTVVAEAVNGLQAFKEYERHLPDLVTMDITMPIMDGISAVKRITDIFEDARIIVVSAMSQKNLVFTALQSGAKNYIIKPIEIDKVAAVVNKVLSETPVHANLPDKTLSRPEPADKT
jgi:two-component system chemotaxis response regulator CheY